MSKLRKPRPFRPSGTLDALLPDLNGVPRGQRLRGTEADAVLNNGLAWPSSLFAMRFDGHITEETGIGLRNGDPDLHCELVPDTLAPVPWRDGGRQAVFEMRDDNGGGFFADPREALRRVVRVLNRDGIFPAVAVELEFFVLPKGGGNGELHSAEELSRCAPLLDFVCDAAESQRLPVFAALSEDAPGQFEIKLRHCPDPLAACLHAVLLRRVVRECARARGMDATFLAKPFPGVTGNGMHLHISATSKHNGGRMLFANDEWMKSAVAGALAVAREATAFFAPTANSFRRFVPGYYAPVNLSWGFENRSVMVRVPRAESDAAKRLEFRLPGADANPHLVLASVLAGIHFGVSQKLRPPPEAKGDATAKRPDIPPDWRGALDKLARAKILPQYFGADFVRHYLTVKESEWRDFQSHVSDYDRERYRAVF